jgi:hypothetical protein
MPNGKDNATPAKNGIQLLKKSFKNKRKQLGRVNQLQQVKHQNLYE